MDKQANTGSFILTLCIKYDRICVATIDATLQMEEKYWVRYQEHHIITAEKSKDESVEEDNDT